MKYEKNKHSLAPSLHHSILSSVPPCLRGDRSRRGSVLIFAVVLIVLLLGLGTAFILYVRLEARAGANALQAAQADAATSSGLAHLQKQIRQAVWNYSSLTPDGIFEATAPTSPAAHPYLITDTAPLSVSRNFEAEPGDTQASQTLARPHAWLWWHEDPGFFYAATDPAALEPSPPPLRYTEAKLSHGARLDWSTKVDGNVKVNYVLGPEHVGLARRFPVGVTGGFLDEFYGALNVRALPRASWKNGENAEYYDWVENVDGKLYANPQAWGLDPVGTEPQDALAKAVLKALHSLSGLSPSLSDTDRDNLWTRVAPYASTSELWLYLNSPPKVLLPRDFLAARYGLDRYVCVARDVALTLAEQTKYGVPFGSVKDLEAALNVNTANLETLTAALSRVPLVDGFDPANAVTVTANLTKASALAARICAKRPFVCRMDFEDFLAAHLNRVEPTAPGQVDPLDTASPDITKPVGMIYAAIAKRINSINPPTPPPALPPPPNLADMLEISGVIDTHPVYAKLLNLVFQQGRFAWFRADNTQAPLYVDATNNALLNAKAFNHVLNSVSGKRRDGSYGYSYYSHELLTIPFTVPPGGPPKFEYAELLQADITGGIKTYAVTRPAPDDAKGTLKAWRATNGSGYYEMTFAVSNDTQEKEYGTVVTTTNPGDRVDFILGTDAKSESPNWGNDVFDLATGNIYELSDATSNCTCESTVHAPLRAYRLDPPLVLLVPPRIVDDPATASLLTATTTTATNGGNGDVSWSPRFAFRGRFFALYVLARGLDVNGNPYPGGARRVEALYDALKDRIVWHRQASTEKRSLSDPEP